jgi:hypothetical protein
MHCHDHQNSYSGVGPWTCSLHHGKSTTAFWDVAPCSLVEVYRRFTGARCLLPPSSGNCLCTVFLQLDIPGSCLYSRWKQSAMALYLTWLWCLTVHLNCHTFKRMAASGSGAIPGDLLWNCIGNFCSEAFLGAIQGWRYIEGRCIGGWLCFHLSKNIYCLSML